MSELVDAIRAKFATPQEALQSMGLDDTLLDNESTRLRKRIDKLIHVLSKQQASKKAVPRGRDQLTEPRHAASDPRGNSGGERGGWRSGQDNFDLPSGSPDLAKKRETMPPANTSTGEVRETLSGEDEFSPEEERSLQDYAADMRKRGSDAEVIDHAMRMARDILRRHRSGRDELPSNRIGSRERELPNGGHFGGARHSGEMPNGRDWMTPEEEAKGKFLVDHGLDDQESFEKRWPEIARIGHEPESHGRFGTRYGMDKAKPAPSKAQMAKLYEKFPGLALIGQA